MLTKFFEYIYVINLAERADRREEVSEQLVKLGLTLTSKNVILFPASRPPSAGDFPSVGAHGCFLSHLGVIEDAVARQAKSILILEDDCDFGEVTQVERAIQSISLHGNGWHIFYGGFTALTPPKNIIAKDTLTIAEPSCTLGQTHCIGFNGSILPALNSYLRSIYSRSAGDARGGPMHVDGAYCWFRREHTELQTICCIPNIAFQRPSKSDIAPTRKLESSRIGKVFVSFIRFLKRSLKLHTI